MSTALRPETSLPPADSERRRHQRMDYRTAVVAVVDTPGGLQCRRCQTDDLSFEGARLICFEPLPSSAVYLRILMPGLSERFVEADVVNERVQSELRIGAGRESRYIYGVRFRRVVADDGVLQRLRAAVAPASEPGARL